MARFIHTADWQIGTRFGQFEPDVASLLIEARFEAVERIAALASNRRVDAVLVAGDVFDMQTVTDRVIRRLFSALEGFKGVWVLIPGNHDAAIPESVWSRACRLNCIPPNVKVVTSSQVLNLDCHMSVIAAPLTQRHTYDDVTEFFDTAETPADNVRIGLSHGSVTRQLPDSIDSTNPIADDRAQRARMDYCAYGDWHGVYRVDDRTWYSGTPETDRFRNNRSGFALEVDIATRGDTPKITEHAIGKFAWHKWDLTLTVPSDLDVLSARLATLTSRDVLHLTVSGTIDIAASARLEAAIDGTAAKVRTDLTGLRLAPTHDDIESLGAGHGYLSKVVARLKAAQDNQKVGSAATEALMILSRLTANKAKAS